jgi:hypothetical protein
VDLAAFIVISCRPSSARRGGLLPPLEGVPEIRVAEGRGGPLGEEGDAAGLEVLERKAGARRSLRAPSLAAAAELAHARRRRADGMGNRRGDEPPALGQAAGAGTAARRGLCRAGWECQMWRRWE